jgi:phosphoserine phosphatase
VELAVVSGGIRRALLPLVERLGIPAGRLRAVDVHLDDQGRYAGYDESSPLTTDTGKAGAVRDLALPRPILLLGDGNTDLAARPALDAFAAFTGVVRREHVVAQADHVIDTFDQLILLALR